jgi:AcrR family transcriptional regulator
VLDAAIESIVEVGYYRASSNEIARRAQLTWGVIQHHFGTRDRLLLEVVRDQARQLIDTLAQAEIRGGSVADRLRSLADVVWGHYRRPEFLATAQIVMNLSRDPSTAADTLAALDAVGASTHDSWQRLVDQVVEPARQPAGLALALYRILRGVAVGDEMLDSLAPRGGSRTRDEDRELLVRALTRLLEPERPPVDRRSASP